MQAKAKDRNQFVDIMRGIAMLLVVLGHTMTGCTVDSQQSFLFNIIWSLQMPLFILISGYVTKYSRPISDSKGLWKYVKRRTIAYILPWIIWSFAVRGIIFGQDGFLDVRNIFWNMDSGYWFLATIWTISMIFGAASFIAERLSKKNALKKQVVLLVCYLAGMALLVRIGGLLGLSFFAIKLTLYYMPFYYAGFLYGQFDDKIMESENGKKIVDCVVAICFVIWLYVILRYSLYEMVDSGFTIILRAATSLAGCIAACGLCKGIFPDEIKNSCANGKEKLRGFFLWVGKRSLEIYLIHGLLLNIFKSGAIVPFSSIEGYLLTAGNFALTIGLCAGVISLLNQNRLLKKVLNIR